MEIAKAEIGNAGKILQLQKVAYLGEARRYDDFEIPPLHQTLKEIKEEFSTHVFLRAVVNTELVGSVRGYEKNGSCHVGRLIVLPEYQRKGIGSALLKDISMIQNGLCFSRAHKVLKISACIKSMDTKNAK